MQGRLRGFLVRGKARWFALAAAGLLLAVLFGYRLEAPQVLGQAGVASLGEVPAASSGQKVLVFTPHPDDETIAAGGYIAQSEKQGAEVRIVLVTNGDKHHQMAIRYKEFEKATGMLGVPAGDLIFLGLPDSRVAKNEAALYQAAEAQINAYHPDIVLFPYPKDYNPDHAATGRVVAQVLSTVAQKPTVYEYLVHYEVLYPRPRGLYPRLYLTPPRKLDTGREWRAFPLTPEIEQLKEQAMFSYKSQLGGMWLRGLMLSYVRRNELFIVP